MSWIDKLSPDKRLELERMRLDAIMALAEKPNEHLERFVAGLEERKENAGNPLFDKKPDSPLPSGKNFHLAGGNVGADAKRTPPPFVKGDTGGFDRPAGPAPDVIRGTPAATKQGAEPITGRRIDPDVRQRGEALLRGGLHYYQTFNTLRTEFTERAPKSASVVLHWERTLNKPPNAPKPKKGALAVRGTPAVIALVKERRAAGASADAIRTEIELLFKFRPGRSEIYKWSGPMGRTQKNFRYRYRNTPPHVRDRGDELLRSGLHYLEVGEKLREEFGAEAPSPDETIRTWRNLLEAETAEGKTESSPPDPLSKDGEGEENRPAGTPAATETTATENPPQPPFTKGGDADPPLLKGDTGGFVEPEYVECLLPNCPGRSRQSCIERQREYRLAEYLPVSERDEAMKLCRQCPQWLRAEELRAA